MPSNLARFEAEWVKPAEAVRDVVDTYWAVRWDLPPGDVVTQRIVDFPAVTLSIEEGDVPAPFVLSVVRPGAWSRDIRGRGAVFALRLRPAGLRVLSDLGVTAVASEFAITAGTDARAHAVLQTIASASGVAERAARADETVLRMLNRRPLGRAQLIANAALDALTASPRTRSGEAVAAELGTSERTLQRALRATIGIGPNDAARRIRMQEVVRRLSEPAADIAVIAAELGYVDQAHLTHEFRRTTGTTPGRYLRELAHSLHALAT